MKHQFPTKNDIPDSQYFMTMKVGRMYIEDLYDMDAYAPARKFNKDVLIIHGDNDQAVSISYAERAAKEYPSATLKIIKGAGHGFYTPELRNEAMKYFLGYIKSHLN